MTKVRILVALIALCAAHVPSTASAQARSPNVVTLIVLEERPRPDAVALIRIETNEHGQIENTITMARNDVGRGSVYAAILLLNAFRDANETVRGTAVITLKADKVPNEHKLSVEARKYVEYYLHRLSKGNGPPRVVIPLRERKGS